MNNSAEIQLAQIKKQIDKSRNNKRILVALPKSAGDILLCTSLLESLKETHPDFDIYFACQAEYMPILYKNPYVYKTIEYVSIMESWADMEGHYYWHGFFDICYYPTIFSQKFGGYTHNGLDKIAFNLRK
jgi:hypothetical protein